MSTYCGNNRLHPSVLNGTARIGSRSDCLGIGVAKGFSLPYNKDYAGPYEPIDMTKKYCGKQTVLPNGYDRFGSNAECLSTGIGIGMQRRALKGPSRAKALLSYGAGFIIGAGGIFAALYFSKPAFLMKKDAKGKATKNYDWVQLIGFWMLFSIVWFGVVYGVWFYFQRR